MYCNDPSYIDKAIRFWGLLCLFCFQLVCIIVENESDVQAFKEFKDDAAPAQTAAKPSPAPAPAPARAPAPASPSPAAAAPVSFPSSSLSSSRVYASPLAKKLAAEKGLSLQVHLRL